MASTFGATDSSWVDTRDVWNEHTYHITNVLQDGTIPTEEQPNWLVTGLNDFRLNQYLPGEPPSPNLARSRCSVSASLVSA